MPMVSSTSKYVIELKNIGRILIKIEENQVTVTSVLAIITYSFQPLSCNKKTHYSLIKSALKYYFRDIFKENCVEEEVSQNGLLSYISNIFTLRPRIKNSDYHETLILQLRKYLNESYWNKLDKINLYVGYESEIEQTMPPVLISMLNFEGCEDILEDLITEDFSLYGKDKEDDKLPSGDSIVKTEDNSGKIISHDAPDTISEQPVAESKVIQENTDKPDEKINTIETNSSPEEESTQPVDNLKGDENQLKNISEQIFASVAVKKEIASIKPENSVINLSSIKEDRENILAETAIIRDFFLKETLFFLYLDSCKELINSENGGEEILHKFEVLSLSQMCLLKILNISFHSSFLTGIGTENYEKLKELIPEFDNEKEMIDPELKTNANNLSNILDDNFTIFNTYFDCISTSNDKNNKKPSAVTYQEIFMRLIGKVTSYVRLFETLWSYSNKPAVNRIYCRFRKYILDLNKRSEEEEMKIILSKLINDISNDQKLSEYKDLGLLGNLLAVAEGEVKKDNILELYLFNSYLLIFDRNHKVVEKCPLDFVDLSVFDKKIIFFADCGIFNSKNFTNIPLTHIKVLIMNHKNKETSLEFKEAFYSAKYNSKCYKGLYFSTKVDSRAKISVVNMMNQESENTNTSNTILESKPIKSSKIKNYTNLSNETESIFNNEKCKSTSFNRANKLFDLKIEFPENKFVQMPEITRSEFISELLKIKEILQIQNFENKNNLVKLKTLLDCISENKLKPFSFAKIPGEELSCETKMEILAKLAEKIKLSNNENNHKAIPKSDLNMEKANDFLYATDLLNLLSIENISDYVELYLNLIEAPESVADLLEDASFRDSSILLCMFLQRNINSLINPAHLKAFQQKQNFEDLKSVPGEKTVIEQIFNTNKLIYENNLKEEARILFMLWNQDTDENSMNMTLNLGN